MTDLRHDLEFEFLDNNLNLDFLVDVARGVLLTDGLAEHMWVDGQPREADGPFHGPLRKHLPALTGGFE